MNSAYLLIGSNLGDREYYLNQANLNISNKCGRIVQQSSLYETAPWGIIEQPNYFNQALNLETTLNPEELMRSLLGIEVLMGRVRTVKYGPRIIDLDILFYDQVIMNSQLLKLPHPAIQDRRFALTALAEIAPNLIHPILNKSVKKLLLACTDESNVQKKNN